MLSGIVAIAIKEMPATTAQAFGSPKAGKVTCGTSNHCLCAISPKFTRPNGIEISQPTIAPNRIGNIPIKPFPCRYTEKIIVTSRVISATVQFALGLAQCCPGQRNTDDDRHTAGDDRRQHFIQVLLSDAHDQQTDQDFDHRRSQDTYLDNPDAIRAIKRMWGR